MDIVKCCPVCRENDLRKIGWSSYGIITRYKFRCETCGHTFYKRIFQWKNIFKKENKK
jgi:transposase-like protein